MTLFTSIALASVRFLADVTTRRKPQTPYLLDVLIDGVPKQATLLPPEKPPTMGRVQQLAEDLFGDQRSEQMHSVSSSVDLQEIRATERKYNRDFMIALGSLGFSVAGALFTPLFGLFSLPGIFYGSRIIFTNSYRALVKERRVTTDVLNAIIITLFIGTGHYALCSVPVVLTALRRKLVNKIKDDSRGAIVDVFRQQPRYARVLIDGVEIEAPYETLLQEHIVIVNAGETIPVDGTIVNGVATVDQHMLTGESQPVEKGAGDFVFAMTIVLSGQLQIQLEKTGKATTAAQIGETLNQTVDFKTNAHLRAEQTVDRMILPTLLVGGLAFPAIGVAGLTGILHVPPVNSMTISSAVCMLSYLNLASKRGILIKDGRVLELLSDIDTVVFDKTGTLTEEQPHVGRIYTFNGIAEAELLGYTAAAESHQTHPIARAIRQEAETRALAVPLLESAETKVGYGVSVLANDRSVQVGSIRFIEKLGMEITPEVSEVQALCHSQGHSLVLVAIDGKIAGAIELCPTIRPEAYEIIQGLRQCNIKSIYIISGDHEAPTKRLAATLGIDHYYAEVLPADKAALIEQLQQEGKSVCFIGDGINDAIALKKANVSISLKGASSLAMDTAQVILMDQSLAQLCQLFELAQGYKTKMRSTFWIVLTPSIIALSGALFLNFGFITCILLNQFGFLTSIANTMSPVRREKKKRLRLNA